MSPKADARPRAFGQERAGGPAGPLPHYPLSWLRVGRILLDALAGREGRSFRADAEAFVAGLQPALCIYGREHIPHGGPVLLISNHYARPGFRAWWLALALSAAVPAPIHWVMTAAWTYPDSVRGQVVTPCTRWLFARLARLYGFTSMPPMPPDPADVMARALAVRRLLTYARSTPSPLIGLVPEGADAPGGVLQLPPLGSGRLMLRLGQLGLRFVPVGVFESEGRFRLRFGPPFALPDLRDRPAPARDRDVSWIVMGHVAAQLPPRLRGAWAGASLQEDEL